MGGLHFSQVEVVKKVTRDLLGLVQRLWLDLADSAGRDQKRGNGGAKGAGFGDFDFRPGQKRQDEKFFEWCKPAKSGRLEFFYQFNFFLLLLSLFELQVF